MFFAKDPLTGKRTPKPLFWATLFLIVALVVISVWAVLSAQSYRIQPSSTLVPLATSTFTPQPTDTPTPTATWTPAPTEDPIAAKRQELLRSINECEKDPTKWEWSEFDPSAPQLRGYPWKVIKGPECVHQAMGRVAAWYLAVFRGYTWDEASEALGFARHPILQSSKPDDPRYGPPFKAGDKLWRAYMFPFLYHPTYWFTSLNPEGNPARLVLTPRGCYFARHLKGGRWHDWREVFNAPFEVQCVWWLDAYDVATTSLFLKGKQYVIDRDVLKKPPLNIRYSVLVGYDRDRGWYFLGEYIWDERFMYKPQEDYGFIENQWGTNMVWELNWLQEIWGIEPRTSNPEEGILLYSVSGWINNQMAFLKRFTFDEWEERQWYLWDYK